MNKVFFNYSYRESRLCKFLVCSTVNIILFRLTLSVRRSFSGDFFALSGVGRTLKKWRESYQFPTIWPPTNWCWLVFVLGKVSKFRHLKGTPGHKSVQVENIKNISRQISGECNGFYGEFLYNIIHESVIFISNRRCKAVMFHWILINYNVD